MNFIKVTQEKLSPENILESIQSSEYSFNTLLMDSLPEEHEYAEELMQNKELYEKYQFAMSRNLNLLCNDIRTKWFSIGNIAIYHRFGIVPLGEARVIIALLSTSREDSLKAIEWCILGIKKYASICRQENCTDKKLNIFPVKRKKIDLHQNVDVPYLPPYLIQIKAANEDVERRIEKYIKRKRSEIDINNVKEFCLGDRNSEFTCARIDAILQKRKDSKSHLQVNRVLNSYHYRDQKNSEYLTKLTPANGIEERIQNIEGQLSLTSPTPRNIYNRLKMLEDRLLYLESISPEYIQFWDKVLTPINIVKKKVFSVEEIDDLIKEAERKIKSE